MHNRYISKYLCFVCDAWQKQYPTNLYKCDNQRITHLYCNNCKKWIPVESTSLFTGEKYLIKHLRYPSIIDNDYSYPKVVFEGTNVNALTLVCQNFNTIPDYTFGRACEDYREYVNKSA